MRQQRVFEASEAICVGKGDGKGDGVINEEGRKGGKEGYTDGRPGPGAFTLHNPRFCALALSEYAR